MIYRQEDRAEGFCRRVLRIWGGNRTLLDLGDPGASSGPGPYIYILGPMPESCCTRP